MHAKSLIRALSLRDSLAIVIGSVIGTGIFLKTAVMVQTAGSAMWVIAAWLTAGVLSLLGAMTFAELGALFPHAGGAYVYTREAFGRLPAFLYGWVSFCIIAPGSVAAYGVAAATFLAGVFPFHEHVGPAPVSLCLIGIFTLLNCLAVSVGGAVQSFLTALKVVIVVCLSAAIFVFTGEPQLHSAFSAVFHPFGWSGFGLAVLAALWAFDGWDGLPRIAGEVKNPQKIIPLALTVGLGSVFLIYLFANFAYFWVLPLEQIARSNSSAFPQALPVATAASLGFLGQHGVKIISAVFAVSTLGAMNGSIMTSARVPFAMAQDGLLVAILGRISPRTRVPVAAILVQGLMAGALALSGSFDRLTDYVVFSAWIFYGTAGISLFVFRRRHPKLNRPYRVPGYPWVPGAFIALTVLLLANTLVQNPKDSLIGLGFLFLGVPVYYWTIFDRRPSGS